MAYMYCLFCITQLQERVAHHMQTVFDCRAISPVIVQKKWTQGRAEEVRYPLLPGYVFVYCDQPLDLFRLYAIHGVLRCLKSSEGDFALSGKDAQFAQWLLEHDGVIGVSKAFREGDRIRVVEGPLSEAHGIIKRVNKQRQRAEIEFSFDGVLRKIWLSFDWVKPDDTSHHAASADALSKHRTHS